jgi:Putative peptidoglycan binding domain
VPIIFIDWRFMSFMKNRCLLAMVMLLFSLVPPCFLQESAIAGYSPCESSNQYSKYCFKRGDSGPKIKCIGEDLKMLGYYTGLTTGIFNKKLEDAVRKFQSDYARSRGLGKADGVVGEKTLVAICQASRRGCGPNDANWCYEGSVIGIVKCLERYK